MGVALWLVALVLALVGVERAVEIALHRRHLAALLARGARLAPDDGFGLILAAQVVLFVGLALEAPFAPWTGVGWWTWAALAVALAAQALRYWAIATLGERWSIRVVTLPGKPRVLSGPYRWVRHPNYVAVALETLALPLAFLSWGTLLVVVPLKTVALVRRIAREDRALDAASAAAHT